jgi:hypothetical protein
MPTDDVAAIGVLGDAFDGLPTMASQDLLESPSEIADLAGLVLDVDGLALGATMGLMNQIRAAQPSVGQVTCWSGQAGQPRSDDVGHFGLLLTE